MSEALDTFETRIRLAELRMFCLEQAVQRAGANDPRKPEEIAEDFFTWLFAPEALKRLNGEPPTPPAKPAPRSQKPKGQRRR